MVGDPLVRVRRYFVEDAPVKSVQANKDFRVRGGGFDIRFKSGQILAVSGVRTIDGEPYFLVPIEATQLGLSGLVSLQVDREGRIHRKILDAGAIFRFRADPVDGRLTPLPESTVLNSKPFESYDIIFNGSDARALRFTYREYSPDDPEKVSSTQELAYPVSSETIRFRELQLDVVAVDDGSITFIAR